MATTFAELFGAVFPSESQVLTPVEYGPTGSDLLGNVVLPIEADVIAGVDYGPSAALTGTAVGDGGSYTAASNVRSGTDRGDGVTGTLEVPTADQVLSGVDVDATVGNVVLPSAANVLDSASFGVSGGTTGTYHAPNASEVIDTAVFGDASSVSGTFEIPAEPDVADGVGYGAGGTEFTGTFIGATDLTPVLDAIAAIKAKTDLITSQTSNQQRTPSNTFAMNRGDVFSGTHAVTTDYTGYTATFTIRHRVTDVVLCTATATVTSATVLTVTLTTSESAFALLVSDDEFGAHPYDIQLVNGATQKTEFGVAIVRRDVTRS